MPEVPPDRRDDAPPDDASLDDAGPSDAPRSTSNDPAGARSQEQAAPEPPRRGPFDPPPDAPEETAWPRRRPFDAPAGAEQPPASESAAAPPPPAPVARPTEPTSPATPPPAPGARPGPFGEAAPKEPTAALPPAERSLTGPPPVAALPGPSPVSTTGVPQYSPPAAGPLPAPIPTGPTLPPPVAVAPQERRSAWRPVGRGLREIAETVILALLIFLLVRSVVQNFQVEGRSMVPTFENQWYVLVNKALYWEINVETLSKFVPFVDPGGDPTRYVFRGPKRGDVIVFKAPTEPVNSPERDFIKRIIGLPGETVEVHDCTVYVNGEPLDEPYIAEAPTYDYEAEVVPPDHYFVLGDNRNSSADSHSGWMLPKENIIGQAWLIYWPMSAFGLVDNTSVTPGEVTGAEAAAGIEKPAASCS